MLYEKLLPQVGQFSQMLSQEVISHLLSQNNPPQTTTTIKPIYSKNQNELSLVKSTADGVEEKVERKLMVPMYSIKSQRNQCELYPIYFYRLPLSFPFFISKFTIGPNLISGEGAKSHRAFSWHLVSSTLGSQCGQATAFSVGVTVSGQVLELTIPHRRLQSSLPFCPLCRPEAANPFFGFGPSKYVVHVLPSSS